MCVCPKKEKHTGLSAEASVGETDSIVTCTSHQFGTAIGELGGVFIGSGFSEGYMCVVQSQSDPGSNASSAT